MFTRMHVEAAVIVLALMGCRTEPSDVLPREAVGHTLRGVILRACAAGCPDGFTRVEPGPEPATCSASCEGGGSVACTGHECGAVDGSGCHAEGKDGKVIQLKLCLVDAPSS